MSILITLLLIIHVILCILLVLVVLMQRPRSEGLGAAFGGGFTEGLFGAQTTHVLQKFTVYLGIGFFAITLLLAILYAKSSSSPSLIQRELLAEPANSPSPPHQTPSTAPSPTPSPTSSPSTEPTAQPPQQTQPTN
ncbi:MAG: preprotein translocase subunit SecG, partial [Chthoniobacterales bacterium]|nr:preprotein translocase subunit SecG [Chthoniobacterales bacterium]